MPKPKHEWRKKEKHFYLPKTKPELIDIPTFKFVTIEGEGNPNSEHFSACIKALYAMSYALKMIPKKGKIVPEGFMDYTVYPLEGVWDLNEKAKKDFKGILNKEDFVYKLMIRQPDFITEDYFRKVHQIVQQEKDQLLRDVLGFESITDGKCIQMLHVGSYDDEPASFAQMEAFAISTGLKRIAKTHREVYLNDFRKVAPEKLKTVLRFRVEEV